MSEAPSIYAVVWDRESAVETLDQRRIEMGMSMRELDDAIGQAAGTCAKYLGPGGTKGLGVTSLLKMAKKLGLRVVLEIDREASAIVLDERRERHANQARPDHYSNPVGKRIKARVARAYGRAGGLASAASLTASERSARAWLAIMKRWYPDRTYDWDEIKKAAKR